MPPYLTSSGIGYEKIATQPLTLPINTWSGQHGYTLSSTKKYSAMNVDVIEQPTDSPRLRGKPSAAKSWLQPVGLTSPIQPHPHRFFPDVVADWPPRPPPLPPP